MKKNSIKIENKRITEETKIEMKTKNERNQINSDKKIIRIIIRIIIIKNKKKKSLQKKLNENKEKFYENEEFTSNSLN